jgi:hypothetical protein
MASQSEQVIVAVDALLKGIASLTVTVDRGGEMPTAISKDAHYILRDGDPGEPEPLLGNDGPWIYEHTLEVEVFVQDADEATRHARFDQALQAVETAFVADPTLGGLIKGFTFRRPEAIEQAEDGRKTIKAALLPILVVYQSSTRL